MMAEFGRRPVSLGSYCGPMPVTDEGHSTKGAYVTSGAEFTRDTNYITTRITRDG